MERSGYELKSSSVILHKKDIQEIFGFGRDKTQKLLKSGILPVTKIGSDYIITKEALDKWFKQNIGKTIRL